MSNVEFRVEQFNLFHENLMKSAPEGYTPHYFKVEKNLKDPVKGFSWKIKEARLTYDKAVKWIKEGGNIGLAAMAYDTLQIVDCDDNETKKQLKPTLTTIGRSRKGGHGWYFCEAER